MLVFRVALTRYPRKTISKRNIRFGAMVAELLVHAPGSLNAMGPQGLPDWNAWSQLVELFEKDQKEGPCLNSYATGKRL